MCILCICIFGMCVFNAVVAQINFIAIDRACGKIFLLPSLGVYQPRRVQMSKSCADMPQSYADIPQCSKLIYIAWRHDAGAIRIYIYISFGLPVYFCMTHVLPLCGCSSAVPCFIMEGVTVTQGV